MLKPTFGPREAKQRGAEAAGQPHKDGKFKNLKIKDGQEAKHRGQNALLSSNA